MANANPGLALAELLSGIRHEVSVPLGLMLNLTESLLEGAYGTLQAEQRRALCLLETSGRQLLRQVNSLLTLLEIEGGKLQLERETVDVEEVCQVSLQRVRAAAEEQGRPLVFEMEDPGRVTTGDARRLVQVVEYLLRKVLERSVSGRQLRLTVFADPDRRLTVFEASDHSPQINPGERGDPEWILVRRLAELHGGSLERGQTADDEPCLRLLLPWDFIRPGDIEGRSG